MGKMGEMGKMGRGGGWGRGEEGNSIKGFRKSERPNRLGGCYTYFPLSKPEKVA